MTSKLSVLSLAVAVVALSNEAEACRRFLLGNGSGQGYAAVTAACQFPNDVAYVNGTFYVVDGQTQINMSCAGAYSACGLAVGNGETVQYIWSSYLVGPGGVGDSYTPFAIATDGTYFGWTTYCDENGCSFPQAWFP